MSISILILMQTNRVQRQSQVQAVVAPYRSLSFSVSLLVSLAGSIGRLFKLTLVLNVSCLNSYDQANVTLKLWGQAQGWKARLYSDLCLDWDSRHQSLSFRSRRSLFWPQCTLILLLIHFQIRNTYIVEANCLFNCHRYRTRYAKSSALQNESARKLIA